MTGRTAGLAVVGLAVLLPVTCGAQIPVYMQLTIDGTKAQGDCPVSSLGRAGATHLLSFDSEVSAPHDLATGRLTGRTLYKPIVIRKRLGVLTPLLMKALVTHQPIDAKFLFFRPTPTGTEEHFLTVDISQAQINQIRFITPEAPPEAIASTNYEEVAMTYQRIEWTYMANGATFEASNTAMGAAGEGAGPKPRPGLRVNP